MMSVGAILSSPVVVDNVVYVVGTVEYLCPHLKRLVEITMSLETLTSIATIGTFVILTASAIAAIVQLQHLRTQNQLTGLLNVLERVEDARFNEWVDAARDELNANIENPEFRLEVERGVMQRKDNPC